MRTAWVAIVSLVAGAAPALPARALEDSCPGPNRARAEELMRLARERLDDGQGGAAVEHARGAAALCPESEFRYELGRVYLRAGRPDEALMAFQACVQGGASGELGERCEAEAGRILTRRPAGTLVLVSSAPDVVAFLDGGDARIAVGAPVEVTAGTHRLELRTSTGRSVVMDVLVEPGGVTNVVTEADFDRGRGAVVAAAPRKAAGTAWNIAGLTVGSAMIAGGAAFLVRHLLDVRAAQGAIYEADGTLVKEADTVGPLNLAVGCSLAGAGAALVVTSAVLWPQSRSRVGVMPAPGGAAVAWGVRW